MTLLRDVDSRTPTKANLKWPSQLWKPTELIQSLKEQTKLRIVKSPSCSKIVLQTVGSFAYFLAHFLNETRVFNHTIFSKAVKRIELQNNNNNISKFKDTTDNDHVRTTFQPLLTYSNHISCIDDPVIWASLLPFSYYAIQTDTVRWSPAAVEICFSKPWHSAFFSLGKTFPIIRGVGLDQPAMDYCLALLEFNQWLHLFPEGKVMRDEKQQIISNKDRGYIFKWGISKLILDYFRKSNNITKHLERETLSQKILNILPFYHLGMDEILPVGRPYIPKFGKKITIVIRPSVIEMNSEFLNLILNNRSINSLNVKSKSNDEINRIKLTNYLEEEMEKLSDETKKLHE